MKFENTYPIEFSSKELDSHDGKNKPEDNTH